MNLSFFRKRLRPGAQKTNTSLANYSAIASSDVGAVRENNEDKVLFIRPNEQAVLMTKGVLGLVADGMGGHNHGEIASQMAVDLISKLYYDSTDKIERALKESFVKTNEIIHSETRKSEHLKGMGTTCTGVVLLGKDIYLAHIGDSRAYHVSKKEIIKLTKDHTYVQYLLDHEIIKPEQAINHPERNVITRSIGPNDEVEPDVTKFSGRMEKEDLIVLCSDGLYEYMSDEELKEILRNPLISNAADHLISLAKNRGGHDNISVLIIKNDLRQESNSATSTKEIV